MKRFWSRKTQTVHQVAQTLMIPELPPLTVRHVVEHKQRPPAPRPSRLTVVYIMQDGREYKEYVPLYGQRSFILNFPHYVAQEMANTGMPPVSIRYELGYEDGGI